MENRKVKSKMYLEIVGELRHLIKAEGIKTGGKLLLRNASSPNECKLEDTRFVRH